MRHGIPLATNSASQELAILTGAVDAMVVDVQCIMPSLAEICGCYHTRLITTMRTAKIPGASHFEFTPEEAVSHGRKVLETALEAYQNRDHKKVDIPDIKHETLVGFSAEAIISVLSKVNPDDPLQVVIDKIVDGSIKGIVLFAGCNNYRVVQDYNFINLAKQLAGDNILILATGCAAGAFSKAGFLSPGMSEQVCGPELLETLKALGGAAGLDRPLPPVWHMGSCVDNTRAAHLAFALANKLGVDTDKLPLVASAPETMHEKAMAIGTWAMAMGLTTHIGIIPPVVGGKSVAKLLTDSIEELLGSRFIIEPDVDKAYKIINETILQKRLGLGLK